MESNILNLQKRWSSLVSRYGLEKIIFADRVLTKDTEKDALVDGYEFGDIIIDESLIGQIREENHLRAFIDQHKDELNTNNKVLRFRLMARAARQAAKENSQPYNLEQVLKDSLATEEGKL